MQLNVKENPTITPNQGERERLTADNITETPDNVVDEFKVLYHTSFLLSQKRSEKDAKEMKFRNLLASVSESDAAVEMLRDGIVIPPDRPPKRVSFRQGEAEFIPMHQVESVGLRRDKEIVSAPAQEDDTMSEITDNNTAESMAAGSESIVEPAQNARSNVVIPEEEDYFPIPLPMFQIKRSVMNDGIKRSSLEKSSSESSRSKRDESLMQAEQTMLDESSVTLSDISSSIKFQAASSSSDPASNFASQTSSSRSSGQPRSSPSNSRHTESYQATYDPLPSDNSSMPWSGASALASVSNHSDSAFVRSIHSGDTIETVPSAELQVQAAQRATTPFIEKQAKSKELITAVPLAVCEPVEESDIPIKAGRRKSSRNVESVVLHESMDSSSGSRNFKERKITDEQLLVLTRIKSGTRRKKMGSKKTVSDSSLVDRDYLRLQGLLQGTGPQRLTTSEPALDYHKSTHSVGFEWEPDMSIPDESIHPLQPRLPSNDGSTLSSGLGSSVGPSMPDPPSIPDSVSDYNVFHNDHVQEGKVLDQNVVRATVESYSQPLPRAFIVSDGSEDCVGVLSDYSIVTEESKYGHSRKIKKMFCIIFIILILAGAAVALAIGLNGYFKPSIGSGSGSSPPSSSPTMEIPLTRQEVLNAILEVSEDGGAAIAYQGTPQHRAFEWLVDGNEPQQYSSASRYIQRFALATLYFSTEGDKWTLNEKWLSSDDECLWFNRANNPCGALGDIIEVDLSELGLSGVIPEEIGMLKGLKLLNLSGNGIIRDMPKSLWTLQSLNSLILYDNQISGSIPSTVGDLKNIEIISLYLNQLSGTIPWQFGLLTGLRELLISSNALEGPIPQEIGHLSLLQKLYLGSNRLSGGLSQRLFLMTKLVHLHLSDNAFSSQTIPSEIGLLTDLESVRMERCGLIGSLPEEFKGLSKVETLDFQGNELSGSIPPSFSRATNLVWLDLSQNILGGQIPSELGLLTALEILNLQDNQLTGTIPSSLAKIISFGPEFDFRLNNLTGTVPDALCSQVCCASGKVLFDQNEVLPCVVALTCPNPCYGQIARTNDTTSPP